MAFHPKDADMAGAGLLMLLDDIAALLDDVALMTKVAARKSAAMADDVSVMSKVAMQKTAGVLGDDLALNAEQVTGVQSQPRIARGLGGGQGVVAQQGDPGAGLLADQRIHALVDHPAADGGRRFFVL